MAKAPGEQPGAFHQTNASRVSEAEPKKETMSATAWAAQAAPKNKNQRELLNWMAARHDAGQPAVTKADIIEAIEEIDTTKQAENALKGLVDSALVTAEWSFDTYTHSYRVAAK